MSTPSRRWSLVADLRGFSVWSQTASPSQISTLFEIISDSVSLILTEYSYDFWKLLGDGVMLVWRADTDVSARAQRAVGAMKQLVRTFDYYRQGNPDSPPGFGAAICSGPVIEFFSSKFFDFLHGPRLFGAGCELYGSAAGLG